MMLKMLDWKMIKLWPKAGAAKGGCFDLTDVQDRLRHVPNRAGSSRRRINFMYVCV